VITRTLTIFISLSRLFAFVYCRN